MVALKHETHGTVMITRAAKASGQREVVFTITLTPLNALFVIHKQTVYVSNKDGKHEDESTFGYGVITMPDQMQGKGIGYIFHWFAAQTAKDLGVTYFVVDMVTTVPMEALCNGCGMDPNFSDYQGNPETVLASAYHNATNEKGWK